MSKQKVDLILKKPRAKVDLVLKNKNKPVRRIKTKNLA